MQPAHGCSIGLFGEGKSEIPAKTLRSYTQLVRLHVIPGLGHIPLTKLQPEEVEAFLEVKRQAGLSPRTRQYLRTVLRIALNRAMRHGLLARNVAALGRAARKVIHSPLGK